MIFMHGLGDSAEGFRPVFGAGGPLSGLKGVKVVLPTAPIRKVTLNGGIEMTSWFDIY